MEKVEEIVDSTERDKKQAVEKIINKAIELAEQRSFGLRGLFAVRYDKEGRLRLTEKHFK